MLIKVTKIKLQGEKSRLRAIVSVTLDDAIVIHDIKVVEKKDEGKYMVALPSYLDKSQRYRNIVHPITKEMRQDLDQKVLAAFFIQQKENDK